ncbi:MAG: carboxypeptidase regulatory-like domain-containing protein [candidate division WOR-3 bacterium]
MKRLSVVVVLVFLIAGSLSAYPAIGGGRGLFRVQNPLVENEAGLSISFHGLTRYSRYGDFSYPDYNLVADLIAPELNYAPLVTQYVGLELFGTWGGLFQYAYPSPRPSEAKRQFVYGLHDLNAGAKLSIPIIPVLKLGAIGSFRFVERGEPDTAKAPQGWYDPVAVPPADGLSWTGLASLQLQDLGTSLPNFMLNFGKRGDFDLYGAGIELAAKGFALFLDTRVLQPSSDGFPGFGNIFDDTTGSDFRITPGVALGTTTSGMTLKLGYSFAPRRVSPDELILGVSIATPFGKRLPPELGTIAGSVTDARTGAPLAARVNFPENPKLLPIATDPATGVFKVEKVPAGVVVVEVSADGYHSQAVPIDVKGNTVSQYQFALKPVITYGVVAGLVTDAVTSLPLAAKVEFVGADIGPVTSDVGTGSFRIDNVPVGVYTVTAEADGYFKSSQTVQVEDGRVAAPTFALKPLTLKSTLTGKVSDKKEGKPLVATVSFPGSDVSEVRTDPATGVYKTDLPVGSYTVKVTSEGYITQTAALVLEENKPLVKDFELVKEGMTITLRGIYFDFNKATIKPESHSALADAAKILTDNPEIKVEIQGHTDWIGSDDYNLKLSDKRAWAVVNYLVQNFGIDANRLTAKGYGESRPVASNETEDGRALNRRVEFVILKSGQ